MPKTSKAHEYMFSEEVLDTIKTSAPIIHEGALEYKNKALHFAMMAGIEVTKGGRLYSSWIGGEDGPESFLIITYSDDMGESWKDIQFIIDGRRDDIPYSFNTHVAGLWRDSSDRLWLFYHHSLGMWDGAGANFGRYCENPDEDNPVWSDPILIGPGASIKKPIVLSNGEWLLPVSVWERWHISDPLKECHHEYDDIRGANVFASKDEGRTWEYRGGVTYENSCFNEHSIVELSNGDIMMISRCYGSIKKSYSTDCGKTWSKEEEYFKHVSGYSSMATLQKLKSGRLLLIKHGQNFDTVTRGRSHLSALLSEDDGKTWSKGLLLDERESVSYPDICQADDGTIYIQYDHKREEKAEVYFARLREEDILAGQLVTEKAALKMLITGHRGINGTEYTLFNGAAENFGGGNGSQSSPYLISTPGEYHLLSKLVYEGNNFKDRYFALADDIDFEGAELVPIGAFRRPFSGNFDGRGNSLKNFKITGSDIHSRGAIGYLLDGTVKNLRVSKALIQGKAFVAAIVGFAKGSIDSKVIIENCSADKDVRIIGYENAGGIVGRVDGFAEIKNCINLADVNTPRNSAGYEMCLGGIVGIGDTNVVINNCSNHGKVSAKYATKAYLGGILGGKRVSEITNCQNLGELSLEMALYDSFIGGIAGFLEESAVISGCESNQSIAALNAEQTVTDPIANYKKQEKKND